MSRKMVGLAPSNANDLLRKTDLDTSNNPWAFGLWPRVVYTTSWPSRSSSLPVGYVGNVEYFSPFDALAPAPTDRITGDIWTRMVQ
jgi:hypothetical protein